MAAARPRSQTAINITVNGTAEKLFFSSAAYVVLVTRLAVSGTPEGFTGNRGSLLKYHFLRNAKIPHYSVVVERI